MSNKDVRPTKKELSWAYNVSFWGLVIVVLGVLSALEYAGIHFPVKAFMFVLSIFLGLFVGLIAIGLVIVFIISMATILASITRGTKENES